LTLSAPKGKIALTLHLKKAATTMQEPAIHTVRSRELVHIIPGSYHSHSCQATVQSKQPRSATISHNKRTPMMQHQ
jgi:hypothetical protein